MFIVKHTCIKNERKRVCKLHITCFTITRLKLHTLGVLKLRIGCFKIVFSNMCVFK